MASSPMLDPYLHSTSRPGRPRKARANIVLADDDDDLRDLMAPVLRQEGFDVTEVGSSDALLTHLASALIEPRRVWPPDLIIADVCMPRWSGIEVLACLRRSAWTIPIIVITARADPDVLQDAYKHGATAFLRKPIRMDVLRRLALAILRPAT